MSLLPEGFAQLLPIVQGFVSLHLEQIENAARGTLASVTDAPSEEMALECALRMLEGRHGKADEEALEAYMGARTHEWWADYPERQLLSALVGRADRRKSRRKSRRKNRRKNRIGEEDDQRRPSREEGLRIARPLLAGIPEKISLDSEGEYEAIAKLLAALLSPPMGEPSPERLQTYIEFSKSISVYSDALRRYHEEFDSPDKLIYRPIFRWQRKAASRTQLRRAKIKVPSHPPVKPALLLRDLQIHFVIGLLDRVGVKPRGTYVSGCRIVAVILGLSEDAVKAILKKRFTAEMRKHSKAIAERARLLDSTED